MASQTFSINFDIFSDFSVFRCPVAEDIRETKFSRIAYGTHQTIIFKTCGQQKLYLLWFSWNKAARFE